LSVNARVLLAFLAVVLVLLLGFYALAGSDWFRTTPPGFDTCRDTPAQCPWDHARHGQTVAARVIGRSVAVRPGSLDELTMGCGHRQTRVGWVGPLLAANPFNYPGDDVIALEPLL